MSNKSEAVKKWRRHTKQMIVDSMGGKCQCCGYNSCLEALDLHHIDPSKKEIAFGKIIANPKGWNTIVKELRKCILVCSNCHREIHANIRLLPMIYKTFDETYIKYKEKFLTACPCCGKLKIERYATCSRQCSVSISNTINWDNIDLINLIEVEHKSFRILERELGLSHSAIRKRYKKLKLALVVGNAPT